MGAPAAAQSRGAEVAAQTGDLRQTSRMLEDLAARVGPAVVEIITLGYANSDLADDERGVLVAPSRGSGSGVIVDADGYIVTNAHVIEGARRIQVEIAAPAGSEDTKHHSVLQPRSRLVPAKVVAVDDETDLAVIKVEEKGLPTLDFADSEEVRPGQLVLAFGSPMGLNSSVSLGVISAVARQLESDDPMIYIQTDAPINPGNSGGPLVVGQVGVGVTERDDLDDRRAHARREILQEVAGLPEIAGLRREFGSVALGGGGHARREASQEGERR